MWNVFHFCPPYIHVFLQFFEQTEHAQIGDQPETQGTPVHTSVAAPPSRTEAEAALCMFNGDGGGRRNVVPCSCSQLHISQNQMFVLKI